MSNNNNLKAIKRGLTVDLLDHVKPNKDCTQGCDIHNNYTCFECEDQYKLKKNILTHFIMMIVNGS